jgi:NADPH:quinone reductase-like Zn-dependent oxidoreductase
MWASITGSAKLIGTPKRGGVENLLVLKELIEAGRLRTVIERRYSLEEVAQAHRHAEAGHKKGHVVIVLEQIPQ